MCAHPRGELCVLVSPQPKKQSSELRCPPRGRGPELTAQLYGLQGLFSGLPLSQGSFLSCSLGSSSTPCPPPPCQCRWRLCGSLRWRLWLWAAVTPTATQHFAFSLRHGDRSPSRSSPSPELTGELLVHCPQQKAHSHAQAAGCWTRKLYLHSKRNKQIPETRVAVVQDSHGLSGGEAGDGAWC